MGLTGGGGGAVKGPGKSDGEFKAEKCPEDLKSPKA